MQPQPAEEAHLLFRARQPGGLEAAQGSGSSQANPQQQQELQKLRTMLQSGVYFVKLVGSFTTSDVTQRDEGGSESETHTEAHRSQEAPGNRRVHWTFEFKDTPEAGQQATNTRLVSRTKLADGEMIAFLDFFGYEYDPVSVSVGCC